VLRWALTLVGPGIGLGLLVLVGLVLILALLHGPGGQDQAAEAAAARAAVHASVTVRSFDSEELQFLPSPSLVAVIAWNLTLQHRTATAGQVAMALRPTFRYRQAAHELDEWLQPTKPGGQPILARRVERTAGVVAQTTTYQGIAILTYTSKRQAVACPRDAGRGTYCTETVPQLQAVTWIWDDARYLSLVAGWFPGEAPADTAQMLAFEAERWDGTDAVSLGLPLPAGKGLLGSVLRWGPIFIAEATPTVPGALLEAVTAQESGGNPNALSPAGAEGLMQVLPGASGLRAADLFDPRANVAAGSAFLQLLAGLYGLRPGCVAEIGTDPNCQRALTLLLAAYNAGPGAVAQWGGVPPYPETVAYVRGVEGYLADFVSVGGG